MENRAASAEALNVEQLLHFHNLIKDVSKFCQKQLRSYLDTTALLFRPRRILGDAMEGAEHESIGSSDRTIAELRDLYRRVAVRAFDLRPELNFPMLASGLAGGTSFADVLDLESVQNLKDPMREHIRVIFRIHGQEL